MNSDRETLHVTVNGIPYVVRASRSERKDLKEMARCFNALRQNHPEEMLPNITVVRVAELSGENLAEFFRAVFVPGGLLNEYDRMRAHQDEAVRFAAEFWNRMGFRPSMGSVEHE